MFFKLYRNRYKSFCEPQLTFAYLSDQLQKTLSWTTCISLFYNCWQERCFLACWYKLWRIKVMENMVSFKNPRLSWLTLHFVVSSMRPLSLVYFVLYIMGEFTTLTDTEHIKALKHFDMVRQLALLFFSKDPSACWYVIISWYLYRYII